MLKIEEPRTYQLEWKEVQYGGELRLDKGDIILLVEPSNDENDNCVITILKEKVW